MTITRVTQAMITDRSYLAMQSGLGRLAKTQEQLTTGRVINRPSDSPTDATSAMRMRASLVDQTQYKRNAEDGIGWLSQIDAQLMSVSDQLRRAQEIALLGASAQNQVPQAAEALAVEIDQIRESLITAANSTYLGRPVFGGMAAGTTAYDADGSWRGEAADVTRTVGPGLKIAVNVNGPAAFGPPGADVFATLDALATALRAGDADGVRGSIGEITTAQQRVTSTLADVGTRQSRLERSLQTTLDSTMRLTSALAEIENTDLAKTAMELGMHEVAYQAALAATARLVQPSLTDFLR